MTARALARLVVVSVVLAGLVCAPQAAARAARITLKLPASANAGALVMATGRAGVPRGRHIVLQGLIARRWRRLASAGVSHHRFRAAFIAPNLAGWLPVRAVLFRRRHRPLASRVQKILIHIPIPAKPVPAGGFGAAAWGDNRHGELGAGYRNGFSTTPLSVRGLSGIESVVSGQSFSLALLADGTVRSWGGNFWGELGDGNNAETSAPVTVSGLSGVTAIAAGGDHAMALLSNGTVVTWGGNAFGTLGNGTSGKGVESPTDGSNVPIHVPGLSGVVAVAASGASDFALLANGTLMAWGENRSGQLGDGTKLEKTSPTQAHVSGVKAVAPGGIPSLGGHTLALLNDGTVVAWGLNDWGQLGDGTTTKSYLPVPVKGLSGVSAISASFSHSLALLGDGTVRAWGNDQFGELGPGHAPQTCNGIPCSMVPVAPGLQTVTAIAAGFRFSLALRAGTVLAWGSNSLGQLGDGTTTDSSAPVPVSGLSEAVAIAAGEEHSLALLHVGPLSATRVPSAPIEIVPGAGSLTVNWQASAGTGRWYVSWRPVARPALKWGKAVSLPPATRSYTISGLSPVSYEVLVVNNTFGRRVVTGTPLP